MKRVIFRVDSGNHMGIGHIMRCLTLATELKKNGDEVFFITKNHKGFLTEQIKDLFPLYILDGGVKSEMTSEEKKNYTAWLGEEWSQDLVKTNEIISELGPVDLVVIDHYALDEKYERGIHCPKIMVIDDLMDRRHDCQLLLDQNITADAQRYSTLVNNKNTILLMGPEFSMLRPEFEEKHQLILQINQNREVKKILIFFGASDVNGDCLKIAKAIIPKFNNHYEITFILNSSHYDHNELQTFVDPYSNIKLYSFVDNLADQMLQTDLFIGAGGTTSWERACLGVATALLSVADNQTRICEELDRRKLCMYLGLSNEMTSEKWCEFFSKMVPDSSKWYDYRANSFQLVDGLGVKRVASQIKKIIYA